MKRAVSNQRSAFSKEPRGLSPWAFSRLVVTSIALVLHCAVAVRADDPPLTANVILVIGAPGTDEYREQFRAWADRWQQAAETGGAHE